MDSFFKPKSPNLIVHSILAACLAMSSDSPCRLSLAWLTYKPPAPVMSGRTGTTRIGTVNARSKPRVPYSP